MYLSLEAIYSDNQSHLCRNYELRLRNKLASLPFLQLRSNLKYILFELDSHSSLVKDKISNGNF